MDKPRLFSTFTLWLLAQLYEQLPEAGDLPKPKLCFFFDEAHLLFDDASEALMEQIERTARLIRSKGVGVYFVTQAPTDVPSSVLAQLGNRVQHALRAFTPDDADALRKTARTFPMTDFYDVERTITSLGTGEALVTVLSPAGVPTPLAATRLLPPDSLMAPISEDAFAARLAESPLVATYGTPVDPRECARADHRASPGRAGGRGGGCDARAGLADNQQRAQHDDARPAAARDATPGARGRARPRRPPIDSAGSRQRSRRGSSASGRRRCRRRSGPVARS